jgi:hypothetical protein
MGEVQAPAAPAAPVTPAQAPAKTDAPAKAQEGAKPTGQIFKINGKDWSEGDLAQRIQKAEGLEKRVADADKYEKAFNNFAAKVDDPQQFVELLNSPQFKYDEDKQAALMKSMLESRKPKLVHAVKQWLYENEVEPATLTEEQRRLRELERENNRFKTDAQKAADRQKADELAAESRKIWNDYRVKIGAGIKAEGLPETEMMVARIARKAMMMRKAGQPADIAAATKSVRTELQAEYMSNLDKATAEELLNLLPESVLKKINTAWVNKLKKANPEPKDKVDVGEQRPFKRGTKMEKTTKENKDFWKNVGRGMFAA